MLTDGALIGASFLAAFLLRFNGLGTPNQRHYFLLSLPAILFARYVALIALGLYSSVSRYVSSRDALRAVTAVAISEIAAIGFVTLTQGQIGDFSRSVFVIDAFICSTAIVMVRFAERAIFSGLDLTRQRRRAPRPDRRRRTQRAQPAARAARDARRARGRLRRRRPAAASAAG